MTARCTACSHYIPLEAKDAYGTGLYIRLKKPCHLCGGEIERVWRGNIPGKHPHECKEQEIDFAGILHHRVFKNDAGFVFLHDEQAKTFVEHPTANKFEPLKEVGREGRLFA